MHIEINLYGSLGTLTYKDLDSCYTKLQKNVDGMISSFKTIKSKTTSLSGGVGTLRGALDSIQARINVETEKLSNVNKVRSETAAFVNKAISIDTKVANMVIKNRDEHYGVVGRVNAVSAQTGGNNFIEKAWDYIKDKAGSMWDGIKNGAGKAADKLKEWYNNILGGIRNIGDSIKSGLGSAFDWIKDKAGSLFNTAKESVKGLFDKIKNWGVWDDIKSEITSTFNFATGMASVIFYAAKAILKTIASLFKNIKSDIEKITSKWNKEDKKEEKKTSEKDKTKDEAKEEKKEEAAQPDAVSGGTAGSTSGGTAGGTSGGTSGGSSGGSAPTESQNSGNGNQITEGREGYTSGILLDASYEGRSRSQQDYHYFDYYDYEEERYRNDGCCCVAYAIGLSMLGDTFDPVQLAAKEGSHDCSWTNPVTGKYGYKIKDTLRDDSNATCRSVYENLLAGNPSILYVGNYHYVLITGVNEGVDLNNLTMNDFICVDPWEGVETTTSEMIQKYGSFTTVTLMG